MTSIEFRIKEVDKTYTYLNYVEHLLILTATCCVLISVFASLACVSVWITSSAVGLKMFVIAAEIKKYKSVTKKKKKHDNLVVLGKTRLDIIEVLISKSLSDSYISHVERIQ